MKKSAGLAGIRNRGLGHASASLLEEATSASQGSPVWRTRKRIEAHDLLALAEIASRLEVETLDLTVSLRAVVRLRVPVPCKPRSADSVVIASGAVLGLSYPQAALLRRLRGFPFVQILAPRDVWLPNVGSGPLQILCLGDSLLQGIRVTELLLLAYRALSMQEVELDELSPLGVYHLEAARYWQDRGPAAIPLTRDTFLSDPSHAAGRAQVPAREAVQ
ncbi:MAG: hypothetical protein ACE5F1_02315 [Planctomycetota bacterium]